MDAQRIIAARRDGREHTASELSFLANGAASGAIPDYQLSAWLMAAYLNPLNGEETAWLTQAMADSGERLDLSSLPKPWLDKHSTGGVGDKTSIVILPLLASCGLTIVKMSGRGLGMTGGTVDKLGSIPGFRVDLTPKEMIEQARRIGIALTGQTPDLAPADKTLYALRDATATVSSVPLIVSSILSKKIAGGADTIVLDVKCGRGAFMASLEQGRTLAEALSETAKRCGLRVRIALSDMNQPLGSAVGNALEVREAIRVLNGEQSRFSELCIALAGHALEATGMRSDADTARLTAREAIVSGRASAKASEWFLTQGASLDVFQEPDAMPTASHVQAVNYEGNPAWIASIDAGMVGAAVVALGGGREKKDDEIDLGVGIELHAEVGTRLESGQLLYTIHARSQEAIVRAHRAMDEAIVYSSQKVAPTVALLEVF